MVGIQQEKDKTEPDRVQWSVAYDSLGATRHKSCQVNETLYLSCQIYDYTINQYSFNERHVKTQANTCMTYN